MSKPVSAIFRWILSKISMLKNPLKHEGIPGEFGASVASIAIAVLGVWGWHATPLLSMRELSSAVSPTNMNLILGGTASVHLAFVTFCGRSSTAMLGRWFACVAMVGIWGALALAFQFAQPGHQIVALYCFPIYIYAYGGIFLLSRSKLRRKVGTHD